MNKTILIGRVHSLGALTTDFLTNQKTITFDITNNKFDKKDNITAMFYTIVAFDKVSESASKKLKLEEICCVEGVYDKKTNQFIADTVSLLSAKTNDYSKMNSRI